MNIYIVGGTIVLLAVIVVIALVFMNSAKAGSTLVNDISKVEVNEVNKVFSNVTNTTTNTTTNTVEDSTNENNSA